MTERTDPMAPTRRPGAVVEAAIAALTPSERVQITAVIDAIVRRSSSDATATFWRALADSLGCQRAADGCLESDHEHAYRSSIARSIATRDRWDRDTTDPDRQFAILGPGSKMHDRHCPHVASAIGCAQTRLTEVTPEDATHGGEVIDWPQALTRTEAEAARRRRCRVCAPELPERPQLPGRRPDGRYRASGQQTP